MRTPKKQTPLGIFALKNNFCRFKRLAHPISDYLRSDKLRLFDDRLLQQAAIRLSERPVEN